VRYVLEGSVRKIGNRVRVTAQLIDALTNDHLWAERYDREQADVFDLQEEITRTVVASIAPQINLAEIARSRRDATNLHARHLAWRAEGLYLEAFNGGNAALMQQAIAACEEAIAADSASLAAHLTLAAAHYICHLYRWGDRPDGALDRAWVVVERMTAINSQDERTLTVRGLIRFNRGEYDGGLADLRRAHEINPNYALAVIVLDFSRTLRRGVDCASIPERFDGPEIGESGGSALGEFAGPCFLLSGYQAGDESAPAQQFGTCFGPPFQHSEVELLMHRDIVEGAEAVLDTLRRIQQSDPPPCRLPA